MDLSQIKTSTGKTIGDFQIPQGMIDKYSDIVALVLESGSMDDDERQYWFNLYESMDDSHIGRLREILEKEKRKRADIEKKYQEEKAQELTPQQIKERNEAFSQKQTQQWSQLKSQEAEARSEDEEASEDILGELEGL